MQPHKRHGRRKPYTARGIRRLPCFRCAAPASEQWQICADGNLWRPVCKSCDVQLNRVVLDFMRDPDADVKVSAYALERLTA
jgi:hypothetical protein